jgi:hypothetical protein
VIRRESTRKQGKINGLNAEAQRTQKIAETRLICALASGPELTGSELRFLCVPCTSALNSLAALGYCFMLKGRRFNRTMALK